MTVSLPAPGERCRACAGRLDVNRLGVVRCAGECGSHPQYGEAVGVEDCGQGPRVFCSRCGYRGLPTFWAGRLLLECPRCEGWGVEACPEPPDGSHWVVRPARAPAVKLARNALCSCGSGVKAKKCHPERC